MSLTGKKRKTTSPPDGYVCKVCGIAGHWIQQCNDPRAKKVKRKKTNHIPVPGVDPSKEDIDLARQYQKLKPPKCFCGQLSRLKKVKRSNVNENSKAVGKYFFFCISKKNDNPCRFARPVEDQIQDKKDRLCPFFAKNGSCKKGEKCMFLHELKGSIKQNKKQQRGDEEEHKEIDIKEVQKETFSDNSITSSSDESSDNTSDEDEDKAAVKTQNSTPPSSSSSSSESFSSSDSDDE